MSEWRSLFDTALDILVSTEPIRRVNAAKLLLVGDTHGFPEVSEWAVRLGENEGVEHIVFLGDYVDRGPRGVENLEYLLSLLVQDHEKYILLRGNHESLLMNYYYGFREEAERKRGSGYLEAVEEIYKNLPLVAVLPGPVLALHGGIPCRVCSHRPEEPFTLDEVEKKLLAIKGTEKAAEPSEPVAMQILWNDPRGNIDWFMPSPRGPGIYLYGKEAWKGFLAKNRFKMLIRAHEAVDAVHIWQGDGSQLRGIEDNTSFNISDLEYSVVTVFSSLYHHAGAGALLYDADEGRLVVYRYHGTA